MIWEVLLLHELDDDLARHCANLLCKPGSEMSREFKLCRAQCLTVVSDTRYRRHSSLTLIDLSR